VRGVRNPSSGTTSTGWSVASLDGINKIDESLDFTTFEYEASFEPAYITW